MIRLSALLVALALAFPACADSASESSAQGPKADLEAVVEKGIVTPVEGIVTAGQPSAEALQVFADSGFGAVIDMRTAGEDRGFDEQAVVEQLGMRYIPLPIDGSAAINLDNAATLNALLDELDQPVLLHCGSANRVGALLALRAALNGADDEAAVEKGRSAGMTRLEGRVREVLESD